MLHQHVGSFRISEFLRIPTFFPEFRSKDWPLEEEMFFWEKFLFWGSMLAFLQAKNIPKCLIKTLPWENM